MTSPSYIASLLIHATAGAPPRVLRQRAHRRHVGAVAAGLLALLAALLLAGGAP